MNRKPRIKHYWDLVEPYYDSLNLEADPAVVLGQLAAMPEPAALLVAAHWCQAEVLNGGLIQFFANSSGVLAPEAAKAFRAIGLVEWASPLEEALAYFGAEYPRSSQARASLLPPRPAGRKAAEWDPFYLLDKQFYAVLKRDDAAWERAANEYARKSAA